MPTAFRCGSAASRNGPDDSSARGRPVGRHAGIHRYTVGQRKGLNVALGVPAYISRIDPESGDITLVTDPAELESRRFRVERLNWQYRPPRPGEAAEVQIRYRSTPVPASISATSCSAEVRSAMLIKILVIGRLKDRAIQARCDEFAKWLGRMRSWRCGSFPIPPSPGRVVSEVREGADLLWSLLQLTFTHELARLLLFEQLFRAVNILHGGSYHNP